MIYADDLKRAGFEYYERPHNCMPYCPPACDITLERTWTRTDVVRSPRKRLSEQEKRDILAWLDERRPMKGDS